MLTPVNLLVLLSIADTTYTQISFISLIRKKSLVFPYIFMRHQLTPYSTLPDYTAYQYKTHKKAQPKLRLFSAEITVKFT